MPPGLAKGHEELDREVEKAYGRRGFTSGTERIAFLLDLYQKCTSLLLDEETPRQKRKAGSRQRELKSNV
jgi:hypothetical protein